MTDDFTVLAFAKTSRTQPNKKQSTKSVENERLILTANRILIISEKKHTHHFQANRKREEDKNCSVII